MEQLDTDFVDIGGYRLALSCRGTGRVLVLLETGLGAPSEWWEPVQAEVARFTRVCRYDRARRGRSDPAPTPRTLADIVSDLHALLTKVHPSGPYVLVGQSIGGLVVRLYAHRHPSDVVGLVLVDPSVEDQFDILGALLPPPSDTDSDALKGFRQFWTQDWRDPHKNPEGIEFQASFDQVREVQSLGDIPLIVLTAGASFSAFGIQLQPNDEQRIAVRARQLHSTLARLSSRGRQVIVEGSGHFIQRDRPQAVVNAIQQVIDVVRPG